MELIGFESAWNFTPPIPGLMVWVDPSAVSIVSDSGTHYDTKRPMTDLRIGGRDVAVFGTAAEVASALCITLRSPLLPPPIPTHGTPDAH